MFHRHYAFPVESCEDAPTFPKFKNRSFYLCNFISVKVLLFSSFDFSIFSNLSVIFFVIRYSWAWCCMGINLVLRMKTGKLLVDKSALVAYLVSGKPMLCPKTEIICHFNHTPCEAGKTFSKTVHTKLRHLLADID